MPNYEFFCEKCKMSQEVMFSFSEEIVPPKCTLCEGETKRVYGAPGIVFNASGFYSTGG